MTEIRETAVFLALALAVMVGWYGLYVRPADAARDAIMDCMVEKGGDLHSRDAYDACVTELRGEK
jgi:hypothetical protein